MWADGRAVPLPTGLQAALAAAGPIVTSTRAAARAMHAQLRERDYAPFVTGELARWGHPAAPGAWWEPYAGVVQGGGWRCVVA